MVSFHPLRIGLFFLANGRTPWLINGGVPTNWDKTTMCVYLALSVFFDLHLSWVQKPANTGWGAQHPEARSPEIARARKIWSLRDVHETLLIVHADWTSDAIPMPDHTGRAPEWGSCLSTSWRNHVAKVSGNVQLRAKRRGLPSSTLRWPWTKFMKSGVTLLATTRAFVVHHPAHGQSC